MKRFIVETDNEEHGKLLLGLMQELKFVTHVRPFSSEDLSEESWVREGRPATDEELEKYSLEAERGAFITGEKSKSDTYKKIERWKKGNSK